MKLKTTARRPGSKAAIESLETRALLSTVAVTSLADTGAGSLRAAISSAASRDTIDFGSLTGTVTLASALDFSGKTLAVHGSGRSQLTLDGSGLNVSAITSTSNSDLTLTDLTLIGGHASGRGGAIKMTPSEGATLTLDNVDVTGAQSGEYGGAIYTTGVSLFVDHSNFYGNSTSGDGAYGGAIYANGGGLNFANSTFNDNSATSTYDNDSAGGGAIYAVDVLLDMTNCTVTDNHLTKISSGSVGPESNTRGAGIWVSGQFHILSSTIARNALVNAVNNGEGNYGGGLFGSTQGLNVVSSIQDTIIAANTSVEGTDLKVGGPTTISHSLIGDGSVANDGSDVVNGQNGNIAGNPRTPSNPATPVNPKLGLLANNGGTGKTLALLAGSPAIDAADSGAPSTDQRGNARVGTADIGAYEYPGGSTPTAPAFDRTPRAYVDVVEGKTGTLVGTAAAGSDSVTYHWKRISKPANAADPVLDDADAGRTGVTFRKAGTYEYRLIATSADSGLSVSKRVVFTVDAIASGLTIVQHKQTLSGARATKMRAYVFDQFRSRLVEQPRITWSLLEGEGAVSRSTGIYRPDDSAGYTRLRFEATSGDLSGTAVNYVRAA